jgi:hypothetical protein
MEYATPAPLQEMSLRWGNLILPRKPSLIQIKHKQAGL